MPAGVSWSRYLTFLGAALLSMFAGAQVVHSVYRPLDDLDKLIEMELEMELERNQEKPGETAK